jgi:hypothetical protein
MAKVSNETEIEDLSDKIVSECAGGDFETESDGLLAPMCRDRLLNKCGNTGVMSSLIGGFALGALRKAVAGEGASKLDTYIYILSYVTVHACTCSALGSAFLYGAINKMSEASAVRWGKKNWFILMLPMIKFVMGVMAYMVSGLGNNAEYTHTLTTSLHAVPHSFKPTHQVSVILTCWRDMGGDSLAQIICLAIGIMSIGSVWGLYFLIEHSMRAGANKQQ